MAALYQLSYVGANPNPSVVAADLDMIRHEMTTSAPSFLGVFSWRFLGRLRGDFIPELIPHRYDRRQKPGQDGT
jgi:hypothetical protein